MPAAAALVLGVVLTHAQAPGAGASARSAAGAGRPREHAAANGPRWRRPGTGPRRQPGIAAAAADATPQAYPPEQVQAGSRALRLAVRVLPRARRDGRRDRSRPHALARSSPKTSAATRSRRSSTTAAPTRACRRSTCREADLAAIVAFIHDTKVKAESLEGQPPQRGRRRPADRQRAGRAAVLQRRGRLREVPFADRRFRRPRHAPAGSCAAAAHAVSGRPRARRRAAAAPMATITLPSGQTVTGRLAYRDEFTIAHHRRGRLVPLVADEPGEGQRQRSARRPHRAAAEIHRTTICTTCSRTCRR